MKWIIFCIMVVVTVEQAFASAIIISQDAFSGNETTIYDWPGDTATPIQDFNVKGVNFVNWGDEYGFIVMPNSTTQTLFGAIPGASLGSSLGDAAGPNGNIAITFTDSGSEVHRVGFLIHGQGTYKITVKNLVSNDYAVLPLALLKTPAVAAFFGMETNFDIDYLHIEKVTGQSSTTIDDFRFEAVPEPSTLVLLGMGAIGLLAYAGFKPLIFMRCKMRKSIMSIVALSVCAISVPVKAVTLNEDFSGGIQPGLWNIIRNDAADAPWTITAPDSFGGLQLSKGADSDPISPSVAGIASRFQLIGDFSVAVNFNLLNFPDPIVYGWNEAILRVGFSIPETDFFEVLRFTRSDKAQKQWVEGWSSQPPPYRQFGLAADSTLQGAFRITRSGETLSAWIDRGTGYVLIGSQTSPLFTEPATVQMIATQIAGTSRPVTSLDVRFDNLSITAESIVPEPSTFALLGMGAISMIIYTWRRRKR